MKPNPETKLPEQKEPEPPQPTERELLAAILSELKTLNELAKTSGVCVRDKFR